MPETRVKFYGRMYEIAEMELIQTGQRGEFESAFDTCIRDAAARGYRQCLHDFTAFMVLNKDDPGVDMAYAWLVDFAKEHGMEDEIDRGKR